MTGKLLECTQVTRSYRRGGLLRRASFDAVADVNLELSEAQPEILAIVGESGSGKTTLARMILNLETPIRSDSVVTTSPASVPARTGSPSCDRYNRYFRTRSRRSTR